MAKVHAKLGRNYKTILQSDRHVLIGDEPLSMGGSNMGMSPNQLLLSALTACKVMTIRWYAEKNNLSVDAVHADATLDSTRSKEGTHTTIRCQLNIEGNLSAAQREKLIQVADRCPVHRMLNGSFDIVTEGLY